MDSHMFDGLVPGLICIGIAIGGAICGLIVVAIVWVWPAVKPWLHSLTA